MTAEKLPPWSPNWLPIEQVHARLCPLIGNRHLAAHDLTMVFAGLSGTPYVRTRRRWYRRPDRARVNDPRLWAVRFKLSSWTDGLYVEYRAHRYRRPGLVLAQFLRGYFFHAWLPDLAEAWPTIFAPAPTPPVRVELADKIKVQLVEKPTPPAKAQSSSQTEDQIQKLMGDVSGLRDTEKKIRRYAVLKYGVRWKETDPAKVRKDAQSDELYQKVVGVVVHHISTFRRVGYATKNNLALGHPWPPPGHFFGHPPPP